MMWICTIFGWTIALGQIVNLARVLFYDTPGSVPLLVFFTLACLGLAVSSTIMTIKAYNL